MSVLKPIDKCVTCQRIANPNVLQYANEKRNNGSFNDVTIEAGPLTIAANRMILSCCSRFFEAMFDLEMKEKYQNPVQIHGVDGAAVKSVIDFMYSGEVKITSKNVMELIAVSDYLQVTEVKRFCFEFLESILSLDNWFAILSAAKLYQNENLQNQVYDCVSNNFNDVIQTDEFNSLACNVFVALISNLNRSQIEELSMFKGLVTWCRHDEADRKTEFLALFEEMINLDKIPTNSLEEIVLKVVKSMIFQERNLHNEATIISLGGKKSSRQCVEVFNCSIKSQQKFPDLPKNLASHCTLKSGAYVYLIGGKTTEDDNISNINENVWCLNIKDEEFKWKEVAPLRQKRHVMGSAVFRDTLVVAGGYNSNNGVLNSVEYYQAAFKKWQFASPLRNARSGCAMVASDEHLYVLGGLVNNKCSLSVERIDNLSEDWTEIQPMQTPRRWFAAVICNEVIYVIGGQRDANKSITTNMVEKYDFREEKWVYVSNMITERRAHAACVMNGKIYVVGGLDSSREAVKSIECFDPEKDSWSVVGNLTDLNLFNHSLIVL